MQNDDISEFGPIESSGSKEIAPLNREVPINQKEASIKDKPRSYTQWAQVMNNKFLATGDTCNILPAGIYNISNSDSGFIFNKQDICIDELINFQNSRMSEVLSEINTFWTNHAKFKEYKFLHRRGYLFFGPAGSGKTSMVQQIIADVVARNGLAFYIEGHPRVTSEGLGYALRSVEKDRPIVCILEDIDAVIRNYGESDILSFLDGETRVDRMITIATTNYPELLDKRIIARPRRFDRLVYIGMPDESIRRHYFTMKLVNSSEKEIEEWVELSKNFSFAALSDLIISVKCLGNDLYETVDHLKQLLRAKPSSTKFEEEQKFGFNNEDPL